MYHRGIAADIRAYPRSAGLERQVDKLTSGEDRKTQGGQALDHTNEEEVALKMLVRIFLDYTNSSRAPS